MKSVLPNLPRKMIKMINQKKKKKRKEKRRRKKRNLKKKRNQRPLMINNNYVKNVYNGSMYIIYY